jgi:predicted DNA binding protein
MITERNKNLLLISLKQIPIIELACKKSNISRATFYRLKKQNKDFAEAVNEAIVEGEGLITDMSESQLIALIKDKNFQAIQLWLKHHHHKYNDRIEITGNLSIEDEKLTDEQSAIVKQALKLGLFNQKYDKEK